MQLLDLRWSGLPSTELVSRTEDYYSEILTALPCATRLGSLSVTNSVVPKASLRVFAAQLPRMLALQELDLGGLELGPDGIAVLARGMTQVPGLRLLGLRRCALLPKGATHLAHWMAVFWELRELDAAENHIDAEAATNLLAVVPLCRNLRCLNLSANAFASASAAGRGHTQSEYPDEEHMVAAFWRRLQSREGQHVEVFGL